MLCPNLFETNFKTDEKFNAEGIWNGIWNLAAKGY